MARSLSPKDSVNVAAACPQVSNSLADPRARQRVAELCRAGVTGEGFKAPGIKYYAARCDLPNLSDNAIEQLSRSTSPAVRNYAWHELLRRDTWTRELIEAALSDTEEVPMISGCFRYSKRENWQLGWRALVKRLPVIPEDRWARDRTSTILREHVDQLRSLRSSPTYDFDPGYTYADKAAAPHTVLANYGYLLPALTDAWLKAIAKDPQLPKTYRGAALIAGVARNLDWAHNLTRRWLNRARNRELQLSALTASFDPSAKPQPSSYRALLTAKDEQVRHTRALPQLFAGRPEKRSREQWCRERVSDIPTSWYTQH